MSISSVLNDKKEFENRRFLKEIKKIENQISLFEENSPRSENIKNQLIKLSEYDEIMNDIISYPNNLSNVYEQNFSSIQKRVNFITEDIMILYNLINEKHSKYEQFKIDFQDSIIALKKRIYQKLAIANFSSLNFAKVFLENFCNTSNINTSETTLDIDSNNELLTLPVSSRTIQEIKDIYITSLSNGISGSVINGSNSNLFFTIDGKDETLFEYNKLDEGPCILGLRYSLKTPKVINEIVIKTNVINNISKFSIDDIIIENSSGQVVSIKSLVNTKEQKMIVNFYESYNSKGFNIKHLPVECSHVTFLFNQNDFSEVVIEQKKQMSKRKVFTIGISEIQLITNVYKEEGVLISKNLSVAEGMYNASYSCETFPSLGEYFKTQMFLDDNTGSGKVLLKEDEGSYIGENTSNVKYHFTLTKTSQIESNAAQSSNDILVSYEQINKAIFNISDYFSFRENFIKDSLILGRPDFLIRSDTNHKKERFIKTILSSDWQLINDSTINGVHGDYWVATVNINTSNINTDTVYISSPSKAFLKKIDDSQIQVVLNKQDYYDKPLFPTSLKWYGAPGSCTIYDKNNRYFIHIKEPFEPNKAKIKLLNTASINYRTETITKKDDVFKLLNYNVSSTIEIKVNNEIYNNYEINKLTGTIKLDNANINEIKVSYTFIAYSDLNVNDYDFWYKDNQLKGISIPKSLLVSNKNIIRFSNTEGELGNARKKFLINQNSNKNIVLNSFVFKNMFNSDYTIVDYINGKEEFYGKEINQIDSIPDEEIDQDHGVIAFRLSKEIIYDPSNLITGYSDIVQSGREDATKSSFKITVFNNNQEVLKNGYICESDSIRDGIIAQLSLAAQIIDTYTFCVYSLESKIGMFIAKKNDIILRNASVNYSTYTDLPLKNLISIDSDGGYVYCNNPANENWYVEYDTIPLSLSYSIYDSVEFEYSNEKIQYTANQKSQYQETNNHLCLYYAKQISTIEVVQNLQYYSPLIYSVKLGFN